MSDPAVTESGAGDLASTVDRVLPGVRTDLENLIRIPSISADPDHAADVERSAQAVADLFRGVSNGTEAQVEILRVEGGQPAVLAHFPAPAGQPTVLLYAHHDVQPVGDPAAWTAAPFEPDERDGRLYGRGSADDKAGVAVHLAALRAFDGRPPVGVIVLVEGEEEIGSPTLGGFLRTYADRLEADVIVLADSGNFAVGRPALTTSLRGLVDCVVEVRALEHGVHSGMFGGAVPDALTALCRLLATLHDDAGDVAVAGLHHGATPEVEYAEEQLRAEAGMLDGVQLIGTGSISSRLWTKPTATVLALDATRVEDASNTLAPSARAKVSVRLAPGQDAKAGLAALQQHLIANAEWGVEVEVSEGEYASPSSIETIGERYDAAREAMAEAWGVPPVEIGVGGTIPFIAEFANTFPDAAILVTSAGSEPDSRAHGPDESLHLGDFRGACLAETLLLRRLAR